MNGPQLGPQSIFNVGGHWTFSLDMRVMCLIKYKGRGTFKVVLLIYSKKKIIMIYIV